MSDTQALLLVGVLLVIGLAATVATTFLWMKWMEEKWPKEEQ